LEAAKTPEERVQVLNHYFFRELGFRGNRDLSSAETLLPDEVIRRKSGYCLGLAVVYLLLAKRLDFPVYGVAAPTHFFVRYDDGENRINIEMLNAGMRFDDTSYTRQYHISRESIRLGVFLRNLTERETLGYVYANLGTIYSRAGNFSDSRILYEAALDNCHDLPSAHYNLGTDRLALGAFRQAARDFSRALRLDPTDAWSLNNRGLAYCRLGKLGRAQEDFHRAIALEPSFAMAKENLANLSQRCKPPR
jgi:regulator of sirC expression with transglutaminase-like and TPR domain